MAEEKDTESKSKPDEELSQDELKDVVGGAGPIASGASLGMD